MIKNIVEDGRPGFIGSPTLVKHRPFCEVNLTTKVLKAVPFLRGTASLGEQGVLSREARSGKAELVRKVLGFVEGNEPA